MMLRDPSVFRSYWIAGYEGADHINGKEVPQSLNDANQHNLKIDEDYALLKSFNIKTVRESIGWRLTEQNNQFNWATLEHKASAAQQHGLQVIWTLMHYGWPKELDPFGPQFVGRFARFCEAVARKLMPYHDEAPFYQPLNEISFLSWAMAYSGLIHPFTGSLGHRSFELKRQLVLAALKGSEAIWSVDPRARIIHTDPIVNIIPPLGATPEQIEDTKRHGEFTFQAWDMLCGQMEPNLGGSPKHLDIIGINYYHSNQWVHITNEPLFWHLKDSRRLPFSALATQVWQRYERPMFIAETSHVGEGRGQWLDDMAAEVLKCEANGVPIDGICLYPILDRPDWENPEHFHKSGLWDVINTGSQLESISISEEITSFPFSPPSSPPPAEEIHQDKSPVNLSLASSQPDYLPMATPFERVIYAPYAERLRYWQTQFPLNSTPSRNSTPSSTTNH